MQTINKEFVVTGNCIGRPTGWQRILIDALCRFAGHLLWRNMNTAYTPEHGSSDVYGTHCFRCYKFGYVMGDYRPFTSSVDAGIAERIFRESVKSSEGQ